MRSADELRAPDDDDDDEGFVCVCVCIGKHASHCIINECKHADGFDLSGDVYSSDVSLKCFVQQFDWFSVFLSVFIIQASSLHFSEEPQSQDALHGRSAILRCELSGPEDMRFWWTQDGRRVQDSNRRFQEGSNLKFTAVDRHADTGCFQCVASSSSTGETVTSANASINIKWLEKGPITMNEPASEAELEEAERIVLQCHIDGHPRPSSKWFKDGAQLDRKDRILTLTNLSTGDSGIYFCCAQNAAGKVCSNHNITLNIFGSSR
uniref:Ig-like domain-containing protein n=1 Tax=Sinocyclocheilus rhinocerous TaxID=307959 RepID=A0A673HW86_9TELE